MKKVTGIIASVLLTTFQLWGASTDNSLFSARTHSMWNSISESSQPTGLATCSLVATIDEYKSFVVSVRSKSAISALSLQLLPFTNNSTGRTIDATTQNIKRVEFVSLDSNNATRRPLRLHPMETSLSTDTDQMSSFWLTLHSSNRSDTGLFSGGVRIDGDGTVCTLAVSFYVRPYSLRPFSDFACGAFLGSTRNINQATAHDMKQHGIDAVQFFLGFEGVYPGIYSSDTNKQIINDNGHLRVEFHSIDSLLKFMKAAGMKGPIIPSIGNDSKAHLERDICDAFPQFQLDTGTAIGGKISVIGPLNNPTFDTLLLSAVRQFKNKIESYGFEMVLLIYDEPTERLMTQLAYRYASIKGAFPELRTYGVTMNTLSWAMEVAPYAEVLVANGSFSSISQYAKNNSKDFWAYVSATSSLSVSAVRENYGIRLWKYNPGALFFWAFNYSSGDPYINWDGGAETGMSIIFPPSSANSYKPIGSPAWEALREAQYDWKYVKTVESMLQTATGSSATRIGSEISALKLRISDNGSSRNLFFDSVRTVCDGWIHEILTEEGDKFTDMTISSEKIAIAPINSELIVQPNPFNPETRLIIPNSFSGVKPPKVTLHTANGKLVETCSVYRASQTGWNATISAKFLPAGIYFVRACNGEKSMSTRIAVVK